MKKALLALLLLMNVLFPYAQDAQHYAVLKKFSVPGDGGWDYIAVQAYRLYIAHSTQVNILDKTTGKQVGVIPNTVGVHGIAFDTALNEGFTSNGRINQVTVFDLNTNQVIDSIATGKNPDAILYEPFTQTIITCNGTSNNLSVIDPKTRKVIATVPVGGKPETAVSNGTGMLFVNIEDKSQVAVVNLKNFTVQHHWSLSPGEGPTGLAIDRKTGRLFSSCDKMLVVLDAITGKIVDKLPIGEGCDGAVFDEEKNLVFTSNGEGSITVIKEMNANQYKVEGTIITKRGARTITIDKDGTLFLPTADFETGTTETGRPKIRSGTFQVLVVH